MSKKSKLSKLLAIIIPIASISIGVVVYFLVVPHYDVSVKNATVESSSTKDGVKHVNAKLKSNCEITRENDWLRCRQLEVTGSYSSNKQASAAVKGELGNVSVKDGQISFRPTRLALKAVAIRAEPVSGQQSHKYEITVRDGNGKNVLVYTLTVDTAYTQSDLAVINKAPVDEEIKVAIKNIATVKDICITTENNDLNGKLGKPGTYYIKVNFSDTRTPDYDKVHDATTGNLRTATNSCENGVDAGGAVEVFRNKDDADKRKAELDAFAGGFFDSGTARVVNTSVIRTASELKASEQKELEQQLFNVLTK